QGRLPNESGCGKEARMDWSRRMTPALVIATILVLMAIGGRVSAQAPRPADLLPQPLPPQETRDRGREKKAADRRSPLPVPVSPPSINPGMNYDTHSGNLQQSNGNILSLNRSAVYVGAGANAVAAGTVNIPGVFLGGNTAVVIFNYLESRQLVRQREFDNIAVRNQVFLRVTLAFSELLRAEGRRA